MVIENEIVAFLLAIVVLIFFITTRVRLREFPAWKLFVTTFCVCTAGWLFTILEGLWKDFSLELTLATSFNTAEHLCYAVSSLLFTLWCWKVFAGKEA